ncbi:MAG: rod shape-determining protein MreD [Perlucidibaca sp.]
MPRRRSPVLPLIFSLMLSLLLSILPLPQGLAPWRPEWVTLMLVFWVMHAPMWVGVCTAAFMGMLLDVLLDTPLGLHASSLVMVVYLGRVTQRWAGIFSIRQTTALVLLLVLAGRALRFAELKLFGVPPADWSYLLPVLASALVWPTVLLSLRRWTQR